MNRLKKVTVSLLTLFFVGGCAHRSTEIRGAEPAERKLYETGLRAFANKDYVQAEKSFSDLIRLYPTTRWISGATYNWGLALEAQEKYEQAIEKYKFVVEYQSGVPSRDGADSLYRLSVCYEHLNQDSKAVIALLQLRDQTQFLTQEVAEIEVPARTAGAYARLGQIDEARGFYERAKNGLKTLRRKDVGNAKLWLPKTLYSMGRLVPVKNPAVNDFKNYTIALEESQTWLLRASEYGDPIWSKKASDDLIANYQKALESINTLELPPDEKDPLIAQKRRQETQKSMAADIDKVLHKLKLERVPVSKEDKGYPYVKGIFDKLHGIEKDLNKLIHSRPVVDHDTPESQKLKGPKGQGRILEK